MRDDSCDGCTHKYVSAAIGKSSCKRFPQAQIAQGLWGFPPAEDRCGEFKTQEVKPEDVLWAKGPDEPRRFPKLSVNEILAMLATAIKALEIIDHNSPHSHCTGIARQALHDIEKGLKK